MKISDMIKEIARANISDAEIMLFGSRATMNSDTDSDFDILIITTKFLNPEEKTPLRTQIRKELLNVGIRSDIIIQSKEEIERKKRLPGHFIRNIMRDAILL